MEKLHKLLAKKKEAGHKVNPMEKDAKMGVLKDLHKMASDSMSDKLNNLKKVSVAAPDQAGLEHGLEKAKQIVSSMPEMLNGAEGDSEDGDDIDADGQDDSENGAQDESPEHQTAVMSHDMSPGESDEDDEGSIDAHIAQLMAKKAALKGKKA